MSDPDDLSALKRKLRETLLPDFKTIAREWLVTYEGHASPSHEKSLADELRKMYERGLRDGERAKS